MTTPSHRIAFVPLVVFVFLGGLSPTRAAGQATLVIQQPQSGQAVISGTGFPPNCPSSCLSAVRGGVFSNQESLGCFGTDASGSWAFNFNFPAGAETASDYLWQGFGSCETPLHGSNPGGGYPRIVPLATLDPSSVPTTITIRPPESFVSQVVRGQGLPPNLGFVLNLGGVPTNLGQTDASGAFAGNFGTTNAPVAPRQVSLAFTDGTVYSGQEAAGTYPHAVGLSPGGSLSFEEPRSGSTAVIFGAGFPPNCESSVLFAISNGVPVPMGAFNTPQNGMWGFNFGYPPEADAATAYRWQGAVSCDGLVMEGSNPGGSYPRDVFLSGVGGIDVAVDVKPGTCPNPINTDSRGVLVAAILGSADLDVRQIDPASVRLGAAAPLRSAYRDVATPYDGPHTGSARDCTTAGPDGFRDLVLHFDIQALGDLDVPDRSVVRLQLSGTLKDTTTAIEGSDVVVVHNKDCRKRH